ncbi:insulinase family protein [Myxococcota bacterium]|nr:insulinase family protein [Myxococcota bacterium]
MTEVHRRRLGSGLRVLLIPTPALHTAEVGLYAMTGPRFEKAESSGLSHFVEHCLFRGCEAFPDALAMHQEIESCGGPLFGSTARDNSLFTLSVVPRHVRRSVELLAEFVLRPTFQELDLERELILEERLQERDGEGNEVDLDNLSRRKLWPGHSLGMPILGPESNIRRFSRQDVSSHYRTTFVAPSCLVYVVGPFEPGEVLPVIERAFAPLPEGGLPRMVPVDGGKMRGFRSAYVRHDASQDDLLLSFRTPPLDDPRAVALSLLVGILSDGVSSRLQWRVCERLGLAYTIESGLDLYWDTGVLDIEASVGPEKLDRLLREVVEVLRGLKAEVPGEGEMERARERYRLGVEFTMDSPSQLAGYYAGTELYTPAHALSDRLNAVDNVQPEEIRALARELFHPENTVLTVVGELSSAQRGRLDNIARTL